MHAVSLDHWKGLPGQVAADGGGIPGVGRTDFGYFEELSSLHHLPAQHRVTDRVWGTFVTGFWTSNWC